MRTRIARLLVGAARRLDRGETSATAGAESCGTLVTGSGREIQDAINRAFASLEYARRYLRYAPAGGQVTPHRGEDDATGGAVTPPEGDALSGYVPALDSARPAPTSVHDAVCLCLYDSDRRRTYRCRGCAAGFGPDRERRPTPWEEWARNRAH